MTPFETFRTDHERYSRLELIRMLYRLSGQFERILMGGGDTTQRARTARAILNQHGGMIR